MRSRFLIISLILNLMLLISAFAQPGRSQRPDREARGERMIAELGLSDAQQQQVSKLRLEHMKDMEELRSNLHQLRSEYRLMLVDDAYSEGKIKEKISDLNEIRAEIELLRAAHLRDIRSILTSEQQINFDQMVLSGKGGEHRRPFRRHHGPRHWEKDQ